MLNHFDDSVERIAASSLKRQVLNGLCKEAGFGDVFRRALGGAAIGGTIGALGGGTASHLRGGTFGDGARKGGIGGAGLGAMAGGLYGLTPGATGKDVLERIPGKTLEKGLDMGITGAGVALGGGLMSAFTGGGDGAKEQADKEYGRFEAQQQIKARQLAALEPQHLDAFNHARKDDVIRQADPALVQSSFDTMKRFAPNLAADPNAVRSFIRESAVWGSGPSYATLKNLADAERTITSAGGAL